MELYILRHGIAEPRGDGKRDQDRALTDDGRKKLTAVLKRAEKAGVKPSMILTSPYLRSKQTAAMAAEILGSGGKPVDAPSLVPDSSPQAVWNDVKAHRTEDSLLLAGHEPLLSQVVSYFLGSPALKFNFRKGALAFMTMDSFRGEPHGTLEWILTAKLCQ